MEVGEIRPQIVENKEKIEQVIQQLTKQLELKSKQVFFFLENTSSWPIWKKPQCRIAVRRFFSAPTQSDGRPRPPEAGTTTSSIVVAIGVDVEGPFISRP